MLQFTQDIYYFCQLYLLLSPFCTPQKTPTLSMDVIFLIMDAFLVGQWQFACSGLKMKKQSLDLSEQVAERWAKPILIIVAVATPTSAQSLAWLVLRHWWSLCLKLQQLGPRVSITQSVCDLQSTAVSLWQAQVRRVDEMSQNPFFMSLQVSTGREGWGKATWRD